MKDIAAFPTHNFELVDVERYFRRKGQRQLEYISSQGCRFRCSFCADPVVYNRGWYGYAPDRVVSELDGLWQRYRFDDLCFQDETWFTDTRRVGAIAEGLAQKGRGYSWFATMRADQGRRLDEGVLAACRDAGMRRAMIGMEAGTQPMLDVIRKDVKVDDLTISLDKLRRHGIGAKVSFIVGFPEETPESVNGTLAMAREVRRMSPDFEVVVFVYSPYPGNPIAERLVSGGYRFPASLEAWARFDYVGGRGEWLTAAQNAKVEGFRFYQKYAYDRAAGLPRQAFRWLARQRVEREIYRWPLEQRVIERLRPGPQMS